MAELLTGKALEEVIERKNKMRREAYDRRAAQENKEEVSAKACANFIALPEYQNPMLPCGTSTAVQKLVLKMSY